MRPFTGPYPRVAEALLEIFANAVALLTPKPVPFVIMSPDGKTDWTLAAWHIRSETKSKVPFTAAFMKDLEATLAK